MDFLVGEAIGERLRYVLGGSDVRCAVAFLGRGVSSIFPGVDADAAKARIVCDVHIGGTNPNALKELGAPRNSSLRHVPWLHAKVYLSSRGVVIGSMNASHHGIGFSDNGGGLTEAATFQEVSTPIWESASNWFDELYSGASQVDVRAVELAKRRFGRRVTPPLPSARSPGSLLDMICSSPESFHGVGFVVIGTPTTEAARMDARESAFQRKVATREQLASSEDGGIFLGRSRDEISSWTSTFIEFWMPMEKLYIFLRTVRALDRGSGSVFSDRNARVVKEKLSIELPSLVSAQRNDAAAIRRLLDRGGGWYPDAYSLAEALDAC